MTSTRGARYASSLTIEDSVAGSGDMRRGTGRRTTRLAAALVALSVGLALVPQLGGARAEAAVGTAEDRLVVVHQEGHASVLSIRGLEGQSLGRLV